MELEIAAMELTKRCYCVNPSRKLIFLDLKETIMYTHLTTIKFINTILCVRCPNYSFKCKYGACISYSSRCDGVRQCIDGSDENHECTAATPKPKPTTASHAPPPTVPPSTNSGRYAHFCFWWVGNREFWISQNRYIQLYGCT